MRKTKLQILTGAVAAASALGLAGGLAWSARALQQPSLAPTLEQNFGQLDASRFLTKQAPDPWSQEQETRM